MKDSLQETLRLGEEVPDGWRPVAIERCRRVLDADGKPTGTLKHIGNRLVSEIADDVIHVLMKEELVDEYFGVSALVKYRPDYATMQWPRYQWIACYAVTGGSEGHYIHVDVVCYPEGVVGNFKTDGFDLPFQAVCLLTGKTFQGMAHAQRLAARCAELLGA